MYEADSCKGFVAWLAARLGVELSDPPTAMELSRLRIKIARHEEAADKYATLRRMLSDAVDEEKLLGGGV